jgi:hypothetical protein
MEININAYDDLLIFIRRTDVSPGDAIDIFGSCCSVVPIVLTCAITDEISADKSKVIQVIEDYIIDVKKGIISNAVLF